ncbi:DEAD/DEAH box helicase [Tenggerimyces flavus]|uniref:DEAD/DEAH box helicase n=1 Tax=Tenggerimyces flavus TaxID=1708749 RepID=A0ABV7YN28_9ACTN|nr:DEAD/DEAH box helicase [Tenggerimyces flavus]MBM7784971.1 NAD(P)-dependent dehydrogenase (short-subunit alcohol dehydrogenase family) [Tenggerimyces flavus]
MTDLSWLEGSLDAGSIQRADHEAKRRIVREALRSVEAPDGAVSDVPSQRTAAEDSSSLTFVSRSLDLVAWDAIVSSDRANPQTRQLCAQAFALARTQLDEVPADTRRIALLRTACLGWLADEPTLATRLLVDEAISPLATTSNSWGDIVREGVIDVWLIILRKNGWSDIDLLAQRLAGLRSSQDELERAYLNNLGDMARTGAFELVASYHLLKAGELMAEYLAEGKITTEGGNTRFDIRERLQGHFDRAIDAASSSQDIELEELIRLLRPTSEQIVDNSLWTVARAVSPRTSEFVAALIGRGRGRPIFEALPPQRHALAEQGLIRSSFRSVVVSLPTSAGKTLIAEFRILQALSAYREQGGWVAYLAPTRALVNQVTRRLRQDLGSLGIRVERVSPALEVDGLEAGIFSEDDPDRQFQIVVSTPEKLDLLLRTGWEERIGRPLCLVVVDEAHNLSTPTRGIRLELLLATINREAQDAAFILLTPFIRNAQQIAAWLDPASNQAIGMTIDWTPNDRIIALAHRQRGGKRGDYHVELETLVTSRSTLGVADALPVGGNRPLHQTYSDAGSPGSLAAATSAILAGRGTTITLAQRPSYAWALAQKLGDTTPPLSARSAELDAIKTVVAAEFGANFPLLDLLDRGIGLHHGGLPDEVRTVIEYLVERGDINHLVATTTIAQGVNFPVANVVLASHQFPYGVDIPTADFWNLAGRAGRVDQGEVGLVALAAPDAERADKLRTFVERSVLDLNSTLVSLVQEAIETSGQLALHTLTYQEGWSAFAQFLAHTYRQFPSHREFASEIDQILRGSFGYQELRRVDPIAANTLIEAVRSYTERLTGRPLSLVDSTGFSWESVSATLGRLSERRLDRDIWSEDIFAGEHRPLSDLVGVMLQVPELRENLLELAIEHGDAGGTYIANVVSDWVNGRAVTDIADDYFRRPGDNQLVAVTRCCQRLFGDIAPTIAWGLSAMQAMTLAGVFDDLPPEEQRSLRNVPSFVFYGVNDEASIAMRLLGVPRSAASQLAAAMHSEQMMTGVRDDSELQIGEIRERLSRLSQSDWVRFLGDAGNAYQAVWEIMDGSR